jgi:hypothetical protein
MVKVVLALELLLNEQAPLLIDGRLQVWIGGVSLAAGKAGRGAKAINLRRGAGSRERRVALIERGYRIQQGRAELFSSLCSSTLGGLTTAMLLTPLPSM